MKGSEDFNGVQLKRRTIEEIYIHIDRDRERHRKIYTNSG